MRKMLICVVIVKLLCIVTISAINNKKLPQHVQPYFYDITIDVNMNKKSFEGFAKIYVNILEDTNIIKFHLKELTVINATVCHSEKFIKVAVNDKEKSDDCDHDIQTIFRENLSAGKYRLEIYYTGNLYTDQKGLHIINQLGKNVNENEAVVTFLEPAYARRVFPCFDEPSFKAQFSITLIRNEKYNTISNMPLKGTTDLKNGLFRDVFEVTPFMSTHQVAFAITNFKKTAYARGTFFSNPFRYLAPDSFVIHNYGSEVITAIEDYVKVKFDLPKLDVIAVPNISGIESGASSYGLVLLSENEAFEDPRSKILDQQKAILLMANEFLQQWCGIKMTARWWNQIWFTKGMATYLQYTIGHQLFKEWNLKDYGPFFLLRDAVEADCSKYPKPLSYLDPWVNSGYKFSYYTEIAYKKAAMIFHTVKNILGEEIFQNILKIYLDKAREEDTSTPSEFWNIIAEHYTDFKDDDFNVIKSIETWVNNPGVPIVQCTRSYDYEHSRWKLLQKRLGSKEPYGSGEWNIPIISHAAGIETFQELRPTTWLFPFKHDLWEDKENIKVRDWVIINAEAAYYYLVNYDEINWKLLATALNKENFSNIPPVTRAKLVYDAFTLARYGELKYSTALEFVKYLEKERDYIALNSFFYVFEFFYKKFSGLRDFHHLEVYLAKALQPAFETIVGKTEEDLLRNGKNDIDTLNKAQIIKWACHLGNQLCRDITTRALRIGGYPVDLKDSIICGGFIQLDIDWWLAYMRYNDTSIYKHMGCPHDPEALEWLISSYLFEQEPWADSWSFKQIYTKGIVQLKYVLKSYTEFCDIYYDRMPENVLAENIIDMADYITTEDQLAVLKNFFRRKPGGIDDKSDFGKASTKALSIASTNIEWVNEHFEDITAWIKREIVTSK